MVRVVPDIFKRNYRMALGNSYSYLESQNVLLDSKLNIRDGEVAHVPTAGRRSSWCIHHVISRRLLPSIRGCNELKREDHRND